MEKKLLKTRNIELKPAWTEALGMGGGIGWSQEIRLRAAEAVGKSRNPHLSDT